ncbi:MAG: NUDIX hydrolase [Bacillus sp. (in: firmicutes)]
MELLTFGKKEEGIEYIHRPAVYCVMFNEQKDQIAIIQSGNGKYFLPGGGIEHDETHEACLKREALEEMGMAVELGDFIGCAQRYFFSTSEYIHYLNIGNFYLCETGKKVSEPTEEEDFLIWVEPARALENLFHEHQAWAVKEALNRIYS